MYVAATALAAGLVCEAARVRRYLKHSIPVTLTFHCIMFSIASRLALRMFAMAESRLSIVLFHHVLPQFDALLPNEPDIESFAAQMRWLRESFRILPLREAVTRLAGGNLPVGSLCVTFDDGYGDNAHHALPVLTALNIPATFFVTTRYLAGGFMWNDRIIEALRAWPADDVDLSPYGLESVSLAAGPQAALSQLLPVIKYLPYDQRELVSADLLTRSGAPQKRVMMNEDEIRALHRAGMEIGGHTQSHPILCELDDTRAEREIAENKFELETIIGQPIETFAYPNGQPQRDYDGRHIAMLKRCGYSHALTTAPGTATRATNAWQLPRFTPWDRSRERYVARLMRNYFTQGLEVDDTAP